MLIPGVMALSDELQVHASDMSSATDAGIAHAARQLLGLATDVPSDVRVEVRHHVVTLSGSVTWDYQRVAAARAVMYIYGVTGVTNTIALSRHDENVQRRRR